MSSSKLRQTPNAQQKSKNLKQVINTDLMAIHTTTTIIINMLHNIEQHM